jgi:AraC-like DNA-binding protein
MTYQEYKPASYLSEHVESFWKLTSNNSSPSYALFVPDLVFDLIVVSSPVYLRKTSSNKWNKITTGIYFMGIALSGYHLQIPPYANMFGIRLKPFALAKIRRLPLYQCKDSILDPELVFKIPDRQILRKLLLCRETSEHIEVASEFMKNILFNKEIIHNSLRDTINYILEATGELKASELHNEFKTSKETLRNQFIQNIGITPKDAIKITRFNCVLMNNYKRLNLSFTELAYDAGYYDQSHFIKDFNSFMNCSPRKILNKKNHIAISQERITKRFNNYYAPDI